MEHSLNSNPEFIDELVHKMFDDSLLRPNSNKNIRSFEIMNNHYVLDVMIVDQVFFVSLFVRTIPNSDDKLKAAFAYNGNDLAIGLARTKRTCLSNQIINEDGN